MDSSVYCHLNEKFKDAYESVAKKEHVKSCVNWLIKIFKESVSKEQKLLILTNEEWDQIFHNETGKEQL